MKSGFPCGAVRRGAGAARTEQASPVQGAGLFCVGGWGIREKWLLITPLYQQQRIPDTMSVENGAVSADGHHVYLFHG